ncbi:MULTISPECIES: hypothetical protein [unclassified Gordonia (in: high G+C Gram-positive bacteria)]|uniref:hypothetical protein n=1 Tax=unclassified Gordonia (in: high G+C Gram-positive bacteria) TaxID=2657482 RepID=UPI001F0D57A9|nr:hypothetical protein [Gordonia sp. ABSL49_1]MCH5643673.1 hypothetical protein [Gordonia sp. ABSL49_1]
MADSNGPSGGSFNFGPEDFDRFAREASEGLRDVFGKLFEGQSSPSAWSAFFDQGGTRTRRRAEPETTADAGSGVWAVFVVDADGGARVEQVFSTELDALRANQANTDPSRRVRFLPYGIAVSALDVQVTSETQSDSPEQNKSDDGVA